MNTQNINKVYSGTAHKCMCGCSGKYNYDKSSRGFKIILNKILNDKNKIEEDNYVYVVRGNRILAAYTN